MSIKIPVSADFDPSQIEQQLQQFRQQLNSLGQQIAQANKVQFNPIGKTTVDDMRRVVQQFEALKRVSGDLNKRISATGQKGAGFLDLDWSKMYPDQHSRTRQMAKAFEYVTGAGFHAPVPPPGQPPRPGGKTFTWSQEDNPNHRRVPAGVGFAQAGLRGLNGITGGAGGVAANALGTGMSAGFGAGLMGLMGGMLALGVGKLAGAVSEKMEQAERNAIAYDTLKRTLGDVNVSFDGLKAVVEGAAGNVKLTFDEAAKLGTQFAKLGNLTADQYKTLGTEIETGTGLSRAYGLDPSRGVGTLGTLRGMRLTENEQDSRKMALLIGETIARSDAFAKADEVMDAIAGYATQQTRASLGANVAGYAGMYSALTGSRIPGLDAAGTAGLLARVNASLSAGGAKGEASQFFSATIGARHGLDPFQMQLWREGGAFSTLSKTFGPDSMAHRFGMRGPSGETTFLQASLDELRWKYGGNQGMLAHATANHLGVSMSQAMALLATEPNETGEMEKRLKAAGVSLTDLNAGGIESLSKVMFGSDAERSGVANELLGRQGADALNAEDTNRLSAAMRSGDVDEQKEILTQLVASRDQEQSQGKDIRDSKTALDNIKTAIADRLIPLTQEMRHGIMYIAGKGEMSSGDIQQKVLEADSKGRQQAIEGRYKGLIEEQDQRIVDARMNEDPLGPNATAEAEESARIQTEANKEIQRLKEEQAGLLEDENELLKENVRKMRAEFEKAALQADLPSTTDGGPARRYINGSGRRSSGGGGGGRMPKGLGPLAHDPTFRSLVAGYEKEIGAPEGLLWAQLEQESRFHPNALSPAGAEGLAQFMPETRRSLERRFGRKFDPSNPADAAFMQKELMRENHQRYGNWDDALRAYNAGPRPHAWGNAETRNYVPAIKGIMERNASQGTPLPDDAVNASREQRFKFDAVPIEIIHKNERGEQVRAPQSLATTIRPASPFGTERFG